MLRSARWRPSRGRPEPVEEWRHAFESLRARCAALVRRDGAALRDGYFSCASGAPPRQIESGGGRADHAAMGACVLAESNIFFAWGTQRTDSRVVRCGQRQDDAHVRRVTTVAF